MLTSRILYRLTPVRHQETGLAVTTIDLDTAQEWLKLMASASRTLTNSDEFVRIARLDAPVRFYHWPGSHALPTEPKFVGFNNLATSPAVNGPGVEMPGPLPLPDLDEWKVCEREISFHLRAGEPVLDWHIEPEYHAGMFHVGGLTRKDLRGIQRKLECYEAEPARQRELFQEIEEDDPSLADRMVTECELLRRSLISPDALLRTESTGGRVEELDENDVVQLLRDAEPELREATLRWLGSSDAGRQL